MFNETGEIAMRFVDLLLALLVIGLCPLNASGQSTDSAQHPEATKEGEAWEGNFADGKPLTRKKLDEMLAAHREWLKTADEKLKNERAKASAKGEDEEAWIRELVSSDWETEQGRLVLEKAELEEADLERAVLSYANLKGANLRGAKLSEANLQGARYEPKPGLPPTSKRWEQQNIWKPCGSPIPRTLWKN